jgi:hypothetical protein
MIDGIHWLWLERIGSFPFRWDFNCMRDHGHGSSIRQHFALRLLRRAWSLLPQVYYAHFGPLYSNLGPLHHPVRFAYLLKASSAINRYRT